MSRKLMGPGVLIIPPMLVTLGIGYIAWKSIKWLRNGEYDRGLAGLGFAIIAGLFCLGIWQDNYIPFIISVLLYIPTLLIICIASCIHWVCRKGPEPGLRLPVQESQGGTPNNVLPFIRATREERNRVMALQGHKCANPYCNMDLRGGAPHWDHIVPRARGGTDSLHNMQWLCDGCNLSKSAQDWPVFLTQYAAGLGITPDVNSVPIQRWFAMRQKVCRY